MNLRILKKLSKRAAPLLPLLGDKREQFAAEKSENYSGTTGHDRKHWERHHALYPLYLHGDITYKPRHGEKWIVLREPSHPLKGTVMVGEISGYYEPEWSEETAWDSLRDIVYWNFTEMIDVTDSTGDAEWQHPVCKRDLSTPTLIFKAAQEILAGSAKKEGEAG